MTVADELSICLISGLLSLFFWRLHKKAISKGKFYRDYKGWINTVWDIPMCIFGMLCFGFLLILFEL